MRPRAITGQEVAAAVAGAWRAPGEASVIPNDTLIRLAPSLMTGGVAALTWFSLRHQFPECPFSVAHLYRDAYLKSAVRAATYEAQVARVVQALDTAAIRFILLKGWSIARLYPESGLRPTGDIDLWMAPHQRGSGAQLLREQAADANVDLEHAEFERFESGTFDDFYETCETVLLGSLPVKVLRAEDQVRTLALHFLKHGGWRPIWLCDIAVVLEAQNAKFDWALCLGKNPKRARWIGATIGLAQSILRARVPQAPSSMTLAPPGWLIEAVLREWGNPKPPSAPALSTLLRSWRRPREAKALIRGRWRNPVQATLDCNGAFNAIPRWPYQIWDAAARARKFLLSKAR